MRMRLRAVFVLALAMHFSSTAHATPSEDYRSGLRAFGTGQYELALRHFEAARRDGMSSVTLHYNLGSTYYRLGRLDEALAQFASIADDESWAELAHYNMGLIEERRRRDNAALGHYRIAYDRARMPQVKAMAAARLEALSTPASAAADQSWAGLVSVVGGHDDNVLLSDGQSTLGTSNQSDGFAEIQAYASRHLRGGFEDGWRLDLGGYYRAYSALHDYDLGLASASLQHSKLFTHWYLETGGRIEAQVTGSQYLATAGTYTLQGMHAAGPLVLRLRNEFSYYEPGSGYAFMRGWQNRSGIELSRRSAHARLRFGYELEANRRRDNSQGSEFTSYSPLRHRLYADVRRGLAAHFQIHGRVEYRWSRYADPNVALDTNAMPISAKRSDDRFAGGLRLTYQPGTRWRWVADYQHAQNDSNLEQYAYRNGQVSLGVEMAY